MREFDAASHKTSFRATPMTRSTDCCSGVGADKGSRVSDFCSASNFADGVPGRETVGTVAPRVSRGTLSETDLKASGLHKRVFGRLARSTAGRFLASAPAPW